jgi:hypothetical protein
MADRNRRPWWRWAWRAPWIVLLLLLLYVLSAGPAYGLCARGYIQFDTFSRLYLDPIDEVTWRSDTLTHLERWYLSLFLPPGT